MRKMWLWLFIAVVTFSGCWRPFGAGHVPVPAPAISDGVMVDVIDPARLKTGGKVYFMPFSAGGEAEASVQLDRFALLMVKGFSEALSEGGGLVLLSGDDAAAADMIIKGHVEQLSFRGTFHRVATVKVRADVRSMRTNEVLALVYAERQLDAEKSGLDQAAYNIGYAVAKKLAQ